MTIHSCNISEHVSRPSSYCSELQRSHANENHNKSLIPLTCNDMHVTWVLLRAVHSHYKIKVGKKNVVQMPVCSSAGTVSDDNVNMSPNKSIHSQKTLRSTTTGDLLTLYFKFPSLLHLFPLPIRQLQRNS